MFLMKHFCLDLSDQEVVDTIERCRGKKTHLPWGTCPDP